MFPRKFNITIKKIDKVRYEGSRKTSFEVTENKKKTFVETFAPYTTAAHEHA